MAFELVQKIFFKRSHYLFFLFFQFSSIKSNVIESMTNKNYFIISLWFWPYIQGALCYFKSRHLWFTIIQNWHSRWQILLLQKLIQAIFGTAVIVRFFLVLFIGISDLNVMVFTEACMCTWIVNWIQSLKGLE